MIKTDLFPIYTDEESDSSTSCQKNNNKKKKKQRLWKDVISQKAVH